MYYIKRYFKSSVQIKSGQSFFFACVFIFDTYVNAQQWEQLYGSAGWDRGFKMLETYDRGFVILGQTGPISNERIFLIKTDIDGNVLWGKTIGNSIYYSYSYSLDVTNDGGFILSGSTSQYDSQGAAFVLKLNECGEKQWCKIFGLSNDFDRAEYVRQLTDSNFIVLAKDFGPTTPNTDRVGLMKLDVAGNIIWFYDYSHYGNPNGNYLAVTSDNEFLITGFCYTQNIGDTTGPAWIRTFITKVDSVGNEEWTTPFGVTDYFYSGGGASIEISDGYLTLCTYKDSINNYKYWPYLFKTSFNGNVLWKQLVGDTTKRQQVFDIVAFNDSESVTLSNIADTVSSSYHQLKLLKLDSLGNILDSISYGYCDFPEVFSRLSKTSDDKILVASTKYLGGNNYDIYALKLNEHLQLDTMYNISLNYDSLCSTSITSGFISLDTMSYVGVPEVKAEAEFMVYPNPAGEQLSVISYQLSVKGFDVLGKKVIVQPQTSNLKPQTVSFDVSFLPNGIYFLRIKTKEKIFSEKIIVHR
jgi:hypothetical protein